MLQIKSLNYNVEALAPTIGADTLFFHHDKHYAGYVAKANELMSSKWNHKTLEQVVSLARNNNNTAVFNQVAQVWNHEFFFDGLSANPDDHVISDELMAYLRKDYGDVDNLRSELIKTAVARFGSGWVWLVLEEGHLKV